MTDLAQLALNVAQHDGASDADVRIVRYLRQNLTSEDERMRAIHDSEDVGIGVRVIVSDA